jgi:hypothetical protein
MPSSLIDKIQYDERTNTLSVWLLPNRRRYDFTSVPPSTFAAFRGAFAKGRFFNRHIRGKFPHRASATDESSTSDLRAPRSLV